MKAYLAFHRKHKVGICFIMIQWCVHRWALQIVLKKYLKWSTVIRKKFLSSERNSDDRIIPMQARSWVLNNWSRNRRGEWAEREGRGMWEFQWAIAWMPSLYNSIQENKPVREAVTKVFRGKGKKLVKGNEILLGILFSPSLRKSSGKHSGFLTPFHSTL